MDQFYLMKVIIFSGVLNYTFFDHEYHVGHCHEDNGTPCTEHGNEPVIVFDVCSQGQPYAGPDGCEAVQPGEAPGPGPRTGDVRHVGVERQIKADRASGQILQTLKQQILRPEFEEPDGIEEEDEAEQEVAQQ